MTSRIRAIVVAWADVVMEGTFFLMQDYLRNIWNLSFTESAAILNVWGGIYRILSIFFLLLNDTILGTSRTLLLSGIFSTAGLALITMSTMPVYKCQQKGEVECDVGNKEKALFITGMSLVALGRAACFASTIPFINEQIFERHQPSDHSRFPVKWLVVFWITSAIGYFAFPYVKKWSIVFGVSTICMCIATLEYLCGWTRYIRMRPVGSPLGVPFRVFVASAFKISQPFPKDDESLLYVTDDGEFRSLSSTSVLGFLHKAAIVTPDDKDRTTGEVKQGSWKVCSVSEVEFTKRLVRMVPMWSTFIMSGVVSSIGDTYFVEQATHMSTNIGPWKAPLQLLQLVFMLFERGLESAQVYVGDGGMISSIICCSVAAVVERRRLHLARSHHLPDDAQVPMSAFLLIFQVALLGCLAGFSRNARRVFHTDEAPASIQEYGRCFGEVVSGLGFIGGALSVYVVGKISQAAGGGKSWFQATLNTSRLDRYYWVLALLSALNLIVFLLLACRKKITAIQNLRVF